MARYAQITIDALEQRLLELESMVARIRSEQLELIQELDVRQVALADGCRSMVEWVTGRLDVAPETAAALTRTARSCEETPRVRSALAAGEISFDRTVELVRLAATGLDDPMEAGWRFDVAGLRRQVAHRRRMTRTDERRTFEDRFVALQPNLDESSWRLWGCLPGDAGQVLDQALTQRADAFPSLPDGSRGTRGQRQADALATIAQDSLSGTNPQSAERSAPLVTVFVDATAAAPTNGEAGAWVAAGPRVGPETLEAILCAGMVEVTATTPAGTPLPVGPRSHAIPPRLRRWVLSRDGRCTADGCTSRYRLEPHHIRPRSHGGGHDPHNLTTLCWFHHHTVIHGMGYHIDPASTPGRVRFLRPEPGPDPP